MCGFCVRPKAGLLLWLVAWALVLLGAFGTPAQAQTKQTKKPPTGKAAAASSSQKGTIVSEEAAVFSQADFDSEIITTLKPGQTFTISKGKKGPFFRIRYAPGKTGWISDADIRPAGKNTATKGKKKTEKKAPEKKTKELGPFYEEGPEEGGEPPFYARRYRGLVLEFVNFTEDTMGKLRTANLLFYGIKWSGYNTVFDGEIYTDAELLFHSGAPPYYGEATGQPASGFIMMGNFLFQTEIPQSERSMAFYGFGPAFRYTHFDVKLNNDPAAGQTRSYTLNDLNLGAVFNLGMGFGIKRYALRVDVRYYWEIQRYTGLGLAFQMDF